MWKLFSSPGSDSGSAQPQTRSSFALLLGLLMLSVTSQPWIAEPQAAERAPKADQALEALFERSFEAFLELDPSFAASIADRRNFGRLTVDLDPEHRRKVKALTTQSLRDLDAIDRKALSPRNRLFADAFRSAQRSRLDLLAFPNHLLPLQPGWGFTSHFARMASGTGDLSYETIGDHEAFLSRVDDLERWIDLAIQGLEEGVRKDVVHPRSVVLGMIDELSHQLHEKNLDPIFGTPLRTLPRDLNAEDREVWARHLQAAIEDGVIPAYDRLRRYLVETYLDHSRESISLSELPEGDRWYRTLARAYTTTDLEPEEIFELGERETRRIKRQIEVLARRLPGPSPGFSNRWKTVSERVEKLTQTVEKNLPELFHRIPDSHMEVRQVEPFRAGSTAGAFYERPAPDGSKPGIYYVNLSRGGFNLGHAEALFLHEALPGHHFQIADAQERQGLPRFLRFGYVGAYIEGWGLYAESLGSDLGLYRSPHQRLGRLHFELGRAARLIADVGIHHFGWSRKQAESELGRRDLQWALAEIDRYTRMPGQALSYKIGEMRLQELRSRAEERLGSAFDIRDFHHQVLDTGPLPISVLEKKIELWLESAEGP